MRKTTFGFLLAVVSSCAYAGQTSTAAPIVKTPPGHISGRFGQAIGDGYRDICISKDSTFAVWMTKSCADCVEDMSSPEKVSFPAKDAVQIGRTTYYISADRSGLFQPSMGAFGSYSVFEVARTCSL